MNSSPVTSVKEPEPAREKRRIVALLHQWGIHTVGQLAALSRDDLAARLGARAVELWERANGKTERLLQLVAPPESFVESFEFENEIETVEPLLFMLRRFLQQLATRLRTIYLVSQELRLRLVFSDKTHYERVFKIPQPTNSEETLFRMLHTHLENFTAQHPIVAVELEARPTRSVRQQFGLFETALRDPAQLHETLARLVGLLGAERVGTAVLEDTHRPDAFHLEPFVWEFAHPERPARRSLGRGGSRGAPPRVVIPNDLSAGASAEVEVEGAHRKNLKVTQRDPSTPLRSAQDDTGAGPMLRRFRKRVKATVLLENHRPAHLRSAKTEGITVRQDGPFPLSGNWWDERTWGRVEWDVELENGAVARCYCDAEGWAVDGIYD